MFLVVLLVFNKFRNTEGQRNLRRTKREEKKEKYSELSYSRILRVAESINKSNLDDERRIVFAKKINHLFDNCHTRKGYKNLKTYTRKIEYSVF